ncbi:hypothetical protein SAMN05216571_10814 [Onishia taeanensis]|uniref:Peptidase S24/S26A/S26B/S26C domain-containing protein n=1 Tax=Onishia taeanensis TaxID=284577 RepID=A0A1G7SY47_9GAMM|nr:S24 family peptidase [Halomonas taeanensis]SDG27349.1 hypothetical protein SAMN05216571_10814 [Halomonas taeanensis]
MRVNYLGPALLGLDHPALENLDAWRLPPSCYLVEVSEEAGVDGEIIEGDVLVVDEARPVQHGDLVVVVIDEAYQLFQGHRIGGAVRLLPASGGQGMTARTDHCRGVVVHRARSALVG